MPRKKRKFKGIPLWKLKQDIHRIDTASEAEDVDSDTSDISDNHEFCELPTQDVENINFVPDENVLAHIFDNTSKPDALEESLKGNSFEILSSELHIEGASTSTPVAKAYRRKYLNIADATEDLNISLSSSSSSRKKLAHVSLDSEEDVEDFDFSNVAGYRLVSMTSLATVLASLRSPCHREEVLLKQSCSTWGLGTLLVLECSLCGKPIYFPTVELPLEDYLRL